MSARGRRRQAAEEEPPPPTEPPRTSLDAPWKHAAAFEGAADAEAFLSCVVRDSLSAEQPAAESGGAFEQLDALTQELQRVREELEQREARVRAHVNELEALASQHEDAHAEKLGALSGSVEALMHQFGVLDDRVARVGRTAAHTGDRLAGVDAARARAESAVDLISALSLFDTDGAPALGPLFTDDARVEEAAVLTHRLLELAELGAAAGLPSCARAQARLLTYANGLENRLVTQFDAAEGRRDTAQMAAAAAVLTSFNGGASCVARFVATRAMFLTMGPGDDTTQAATPTNETEAIAAATDVVRSLGTQFRDLLRSAREEAVTVAAIFPAAGTVCSTLVQRLLEQRVRGALEAAIPPPLPADAPALTAASPRLARLLIIAGAYERTMELASRLASLPGCSGAPLDAVAAADELFVTWRDRYLDDELMTQRGLGEGDPFGTAGAEARLPRAGDALARCALLVRAPSARAAAAAALLHALCADIIRHVRAGLDGTCAASQTRIRLHTAATPAATVVAEGAGAMLEEAGRVCTFVAAFQAHLAEAAQLLTGDSGARAAAADSARQAGLFLEAALASCLQSAITAASAAGERTLTAEQAKSDFAPKPVGRSSDETAPELTADRPTVACMRVVLLLGRVHAAASGALDAHNCLALCSALAERLLVTLEQHLLAFRYTPAGGLRLKRDLAEYGSQLSAWGVQPGALPQRRLAELGALANLLVAPRPALVGLLGGEGLGLAVRREEALRWLTLRTDYKKSERPFSQLAA